MSAKVAFKIVMTGPQGRRASRAQSSSTLCPFERVVARRNFQRVLAGSSVSVESSGSDTRRLHNFWEAALRNYGAHDDSPEASPQLWDFLMMARLRLVAAATKIPLGKPTLSATPDLSKGPFNTRERATSPPACPGIVLDLDHSFLSASCKPFGDLTHGDPKPTLGAASTSLFPRLAFLTVKSSRIAVRGNAKPLVRYTTVHGKSDVRR